MLDELVNRYMMDKLIDSWMIDKQIEIWINRQLGEYKYSKMNRKIYLDSSQLDEQIDTEITR